MKTLKIALISITLLFLCSIGAVAANSTYNNKPTNYVNANGLIGTIPAGTEVKAIGENGTSSSALTGGTPGGSPTWYWAGQDSTEKAASATVNNKLTFQAGNSGSATAENPSVINIIIGYNGGPGVPSMKVSSSDGPTVIPPNVQVNFYAAAISSTQAADFDQCHVQFINTAPAAGSGAGTGVVQATSPGAGLEVQAGGTLNVYSGGVEGFSDPSSGNGTAGLLVSGGKVNVLGGELEGNTDTNGAYSANADGISITNGTNSSTTTNGNITVDGGMLMSMQADKSGSSVESHVAGIATAPTTGTLTVSNGTVYSNESLTNATTTNGITFSNGVWITGDSAGNKVGIVTGTSAELATGVYDSMLFNGTGSSLTVPTNANLTIPAATTAEGTDNAPGATFINGAQLNIQGSVTVNSSNGLWFDTDSEGGTDITSNKLSNNGGSILTIGSTSNTNAQLTVGPNGNVTLGVGTTGSKLSSELENYGTITVEESQDS